MNFEVALVNLDSSGLDSNEDSKPLNVAYQNAYNEVKSGNFYVAIKYLKKAAKKTPQIKQISII